MEILYEQESQANEFIVERMRRTIADALSQYKPMREECDVAMARHHSYERTLNRQVRRDAAGCPCASLRRLRRDDPAGWDVIVKGQTRMRYSKKYAMTRCGWRR